MDYPLERGIRKDRVARFSRKINDWFSQNGRSFPWRRKGQSLYRLVLTEILLQRTRAETVAAFYQEFYAQYPNWKALSVASQNDLETALKPIGLWKRRAETLKSLSKKMVERGGRFPRRYEQIRSLPGVGQYVANAVTVFRDGAANPLLDSGMARLLERYFGPRRLSDIRYDSYLQGLSRAVISRGETAEMNWALLDYAAVVCSKQDPGCAACVVRRGCKYFTAMNKFTSR